MKWKKQLLTLTPYQPGKSVDDVKKEYQLNKIVKLASNENPFGCSENVKTHMGKITEEFALYPDGYAGHLRGKLADKLSVHPDQLIFGNGSDNIIQMLSRALLSPERNTVMALPTFSQYKHNAVIEGAEIREIPLLNGHHDLDSMLAAIDEQTAIVWLCSPNNPTGTCIPKDELISFLEAVPSGCLVVLDEAYYEYVHMDHYYDAIALVNQFSNLIVLRTFSKIYGLASLRVGYGISHQRNIRALEPIREPFNTNRFGQMVAAAAIDDQQFVQQCKESNRVGLEMFYRFCDAHGLDYYRSQGNFILIDFQEDGDQVFQSLLKKGYIVRSGVPLGFPTSVRITIGSKAQNEGVLAAIKMHLQEKTTVK